MANSLTTIMNVNTRIGPGMVYDKKTQVRRATTLEYDQKILDESRTTWYHTNKGWICGKYVSLADDAKKSVRPEDKVFNLQMFEDEMEPVKENSKEDPKVKNNDDSKEETEEERNARRQKQVEEYVKSHTAAESYGTDNFLARRLFGLPYQFLDNTDIPMKVLYPDVGLNDPEFGYNFYEMLTETPIMSVIPGTTKFLPDSKDKETITGYLIDQVNSITTAASPAGIAQRIIGDDIIDSPSRLFMFEPNFTRFSRYFNTLCQSNAILMGLGDEMLPGYDTSNDNYKFRHYDWSSYTIANKYAGRETNNSNVIDFNESIKSTYGEVLNSVVDTIGRTLSNTGQAIKNTVTDVYAWLSGTTESPKAINIMRYLTSQYYTDFVISPNINYSDNLSNQVGPSAVSQWFGSASDFTKELAFFLNSSEMLQQNVEKVVGVAGKAIGEIAAGVGGGLGDLVNKITRGATSVISSGANMLIPDIWKNSTYSQNYNIEITLTTPYGTPRNIFLDIFVPMWYWVALAAPRQADANSFMSPFLVRAHVPGIFSVDMGIVTSLTIQKGGDGSAWSIDGYPLEVKLNIQIQDLYKNLMISAINGISKNDAYNFLWNTCLIDYLSVASGIDMRSSELNKKIDLAKALIENAIIATATYLPRQTMENMSHIETRSTFQPVINLSRSI